MAWRLGDPVPEKKPNRLNKAKGTGSIKDVANRQEEQQVKDMPGARKHSNSGAGDVKGDYSVSRPTHLDSFNFDSKGTQGNSLVLSGADLGKCVKEARENGKRPGIAIEIGKPPKGVPSRWIAIPFDVFVSLLKERE